MTLVALGYDRPMQRLFCSADSRISDGQLTLTDFAPKILPLRIQFWDEVAESEPHHVRGGFHEFGFAYCGSSLAAHAVYGWLTAALSQVTVDLQLQELQCKTSMSYTVSLASIGLLASQTAQRVVSDVGFRKAGAITDGMDKSIFQAYIFGFCQQEKRLVAVEICPNKHSSQLEYECRAVDLLKLGGGRSCCVAMGTGSKKFREYFEAEQQQGKPVNQNKIVKRILKEQTVKSVGGSFQGAYATEDRFLLTPQLKFVENIPRVSLIGVDITDLRLNEHAISWCYEHL